jgi:hypothetical protein
MQVFWDLKLNVKHLLLYSCYYGSHVFASITTSSPQSSKHVYKIQILQNSNQDGGTPYALSTVHQLHIA